MRSVWYVRLVVDVERGTDSRALEEQMFEALEAALERAELAGVHVERIDHVEESADDRWSVTFVAGHASDAMLSDGLAANELGPSRVVEREWEPEQTSSLIGTDLDELQSLIIAAGLSVDEIAEYCTALGYRTLGMGSDRCVVETLDGAAKLAASAEALRYNRLEYETWVEADEELRSMLCPAWTLTKQGVLISARCEPVEPEEVDDRLERRLRAYGIGDVAGNRGWYDGRIVCYDYALQPGEV